MSMAIDTRTFRQVVGQFPTGVSVVTTEIGGEIHGMTVNALTSLSLNPMLMLVCVDKRAKMAEFIEKAEGFTINILRSEQQALSTYFAGGWKEAKAPPFRFVEWKGGPRLEGCMAALGCRVQQITDGGDHLIVTGEVVGLHLGVEPRTPLVFHGGMYKKIDVHESHPAPDLAIGKTDMKEFYDPWDEA